MIISRTPYRISFFGGGTDYPAWYRHHGGAVLAATIDKYCYLSCRYLPPFFEHKFRVIYSIIERCQTVDEIQHPAAREVLRFVKAARGVEIHHDGDLPARSGMGSSSAFTVGLLHAMHALHGRMSSKQQLADESIHLEQEVLQECVGSQDQVMAAYGGMNHVSFYPSGEIAVRPVILPQDRLREFQSHLMLVYTGIVRTASDIASSYVPKIDDRRRQLRVIMDLVNEGMSILCSQQDISPFGELLHEAWMEKRSLSGNVSNGEVEDIYAAARDAGAIGGKLLGAGGGGFMLLFVPPERRMAVRERLSRLLYVPFKFEVGGSQIIYFSGETQVYDSEPLGIERSIAPGLELPTAGE